MKWNWGKIRLGNFQLAKGKEQVEAVRLVGPVWGEEKSLHEIIHYVLYTC